MNLFAAVKGVFGKGLRPSLTLIVVLIVSFLAFQKFKPANKISYQTTKASKGTLVESVSASGNISGGNNINITTLASGIVDKVFVKNGDSVSVGQKIATLTLDQTSQQKLAAAQAAYLTAKTTLDAANSNLYTLQNTEFTANQKLINDAVARNLVTTDPTYIEENAAWLAAEASYKNQQTVISQAQTALNSAYLSLALASPTITAPTSGTITNLTIASGLPIGQSSSTTNSSTTTSITQTTLGTITMAETIQALVDLSEVDVVKVKPGQKVTLTLDAYPGKTFTGWVLNINTNGVVSSSVTTYPTYISLDTPSLSIYPNMAVNANIITAVKDNVLFIPSTTVQTTSGQSSTRVLKKGQVSTIPIQVGESNDQQTEILSGLSEGDEVVTGVSGNQAGSSGGTSPFSGGFRFGGGSGGFRPGGFGGGR